MKEAIWSWAFLCGKFLFLRLSVSSWVSLIVCVFLGICSFNLSYLICWCMAMHRVLFNSSYLCKFDSDASSFIPNFSNLSFLTLFLIILAKGLSVFFFVLFKELIFGFIVFLLKFGQTEQPLSGTLLDLVAEEKWRMWQTMCWLCTFQPEIDTHQFHQYLTSQSKSHTYVELSHNGVR